MKQIREIFDHRQKVQMLLMLLLMFVVALAETGATTMMLPFVNAIMDDTMNKGTWETYIYQIFHCKTRYDYLMVMCVLIIAIYVTKAGLSILNTCVQQKFVVKNSTEMATRTFRQLVTKPYSYHTQHTSSELQRAAITDIDSMFVFIKAFLACMTEILTAILMLAVLFWASWILALVAVVVIGLSFLVVHKTVAGRLRQYGDDNRKFIREKIKWVGQTYGGIKGIIVNKKQDLFVRNFENSTRNYAECSGKGEILQAIPRNIIESTAMCGIFGAMIVYIMSGSDVKTVLPAFATFAVAAIRLMPSANRIINYFNMMQYHRAAFNAVYETLQEIKGTQTAETADSAGELPAVLKKKIEVNAISFRFENAEDYLFRDISLEIPVGKSVAFIGQTGSGKTTLADLILGLYTPTEGEIAVDGIDISHHKKWWASMVGYIPQNIYLCDDTIKSNVAFGLRSEEIDEKRVWECLEKAQMKEFVENLEYGLDTITGEAGVRLSGGQRQRIGIARALYTNPEFLVMDEATSALDSDTEKAIMDAVETLSKEKTMLIIAHRLTTIKNCDVVYKVENGTVTLER